MKDFNRSKQGQSLVEIVVAVGVVVLLVTGLIAATSSAVSSVSRGKLRTQAVSLANEAIERTRQLRNDGWGTFQARDGLWCLDEANVWSEAVGGSCSPNIDNTFTRGVSFYWNAPSERMEVTATVSWIEGESTQEMQMITYFTKWR